MTEPAPANPRRRRVPARGPRAGMPLPARHPKFRGGSRSDRLRVAIDVLPLAGQPSGIGSATRCLVEALAADPDIDLSAYALARKAYQVRRELPVRVRFRGFPVPALVAQRAWLAGGVPSAELVARPADVVHGTNFVVPPARHTATVVTVHDLTSVRYRELCTGAALHYPELVQRSLDRGAVVHVPSAFVRTEVCDLLRADPESVVVVPWGVPPVPEPYSLPPVDPPYILALGTVEPRKDYPGLVEAFFQLSNEIPDLRLVIAGADGWGADSLTDVVVARRLEDHVIRLGYVNEAERTALLWNASVLAYPSVYEGFGFPPLEAMAAGVPVVATRTGAIPEVVGDAALLVEPRDAEALAHALRSALTDTAVRDGLVSAGGERAERFSWEETERRMVALYRLAADRQRA